MNGPLNLIQFLHFGKELPCLHMNAKVTTVNYQELPFFDPTHPPLWWRNTWMVPKPIWQSDLVRDLFLLFQGKNVNSQAYYKKKTIKELSWSSNVRKMFWSADGQVLVMYWQGTKLTADHAEVLRIHICY